MRVLFQKPGVTDAELIYELNTTVTEESDRSAKLDLEKQNRKSARCK